MQRVHSDDSMIESQIQAKRLNAPRVTPADSQNAVNKIRPLLGYALKEKLATQGTA